MSYGCYNKTMGKYRLQIARFVTATVIATAFIAFLLGGMALWDRSQSDFDNKMECTILYYYLRTYEETGDPWAVIVPYIGDTKTKVFHTFESKCAGEIRSMRLIDFDSREDAIKAGYKPCEQCLFIIPYREGKRDE